MASLRYVPPEGDGDTLIHRTDPQSPRPSVRALSGPSGFARWPGRVLTGGGLVGALAGTGRRLVRLDAPAHGQHRRDEPDRNDSHPITSLVWPRRREHTASATSPPARRESAGPTAPRSGRRPRCPPDEPASRLLVLSGSQCRSIQPGAGIPTLPPPKPRHRNSRDAWFP